MKLAKHPFFRSGPVHAVPTTEEFVNRLITTRRLLWLVSRPQHRCPFHQPRIILTASGVKTWRPPGVVDPQEWLFPLMNFTMSVRERQASRSVVISGRAIAPCAGKRSGGVIQKITIVD